MKVGFTGAGGTGKTATLGNISVKKFGLLYLPSVARQVFKDFNVTSEAQEKTLPGSEIFKIQKEIFVRKMEQGKNQENSISDRTLLDTFVYIMIKCNPSPPSNAEIESLEVLAKAELRALDLVFYFPLEEFWSPADGMRDESKMTAMLVDAAIRGMLTKMRVSHMIVRSGSVEDRAKYIINLIEQLHSRPKKALVANG